TKDLSFRSGPFPSWRLSALRRLNLLPSHSPTHPLTHLPTHPLTHSPTFSLTHPPSPSLLRAQPLTRSSSFRSSGSSGAFPANSRYFFARWLLPVACKTMP